MVFTLTVLGTDEEQAKVAELVSAALKAHYGDKFDVAKTNTEGHDKLVASSVIDVSSPTSSSEATGGSDQAQTMVVVVEATKSTSVLAIDPGHPSSPTAGASTTPEEKDILIQDLEVRLATTKQQLDESQLDLQQMELNLSEQFDSMKKFQEQQQQLFDQFVRLRKKYDDLKKGMIKMLWEYLPSNGDRKAGNIPLLDRTLGETLTSVGEYSIGKKLGEGEFARVHECKVMSQEEKEAIDAACKDPSGSFQGGGSNPGTPKNSGKTSPGGFNRASPKDKGGGVTFADASAAPARFEFEPTPIPSSGKAAIKIIVKERIVGLHTLARINNEIRAMWLLTDLRSGVLRLYDVLHSENYLYLVMEKGGRDLFEFLNKHPAGAPEDVASEIFSHIARAVHECHQAGVVHRDLKPENILVRRVQTDGERTAASDGDGGGSGGGGGGDVSGTSAIAEEQVDGVVGEGEGESVLSEAVSVEARFASDTKLCDFGLCAITTDEDGEMMSDFCGSPGFFAPEMVMSKSYNARIADVWSLGCVLLEMLLGHEQFYEIWVKAYDYTLMRDPDKFGARMKEAIRDATEALADPGVTDDDKPLPKRSETARSVVLDILKIDPTERLTSSDIMEHEWVKDCEAIIDYNKSKLTLKRAMTFVGANPLDEEDIEELTGTVGLTGSLDSRPNSTSPSPDGIGMGRGNRGRIDKLPSTYASSPESTPTSKKASVKHRLKRINVDLGTTAGDSTQLPPLPVPSTPMVGKAKKIVAQGDKLVDRWRPKSADKKTKEEEEEELPAKGF
mmetsp:Transcript_64681/g.179675  ORF Transcript_64681/g.179675 Transcript_64681/m.179675 type:complete len:787 (+) Transcript_64681:319-2679(+)